MPKFVLKLYYLNSHRDLGTINATLAGHLLNDSQTFLFCFLFSEAGDCNDPNLPPFPLVNGIWFYWGIIRKYWQWDNIAERYYGFWKGLALWWSSAPRCLTRPYSLLPGSLSFLICQMSASQAFLHCYCDDAQTRIKRINITVLWSHSSFKSTSSALFHNN